jgi:phage tail-like protein
MARTDPMTTFHFYVSGAQAAIFTEVTGLEVEIEVTNYEEGGVNDHIHRLPGRAKVADITLRNGVTTSNELWDWFKLVLQGDFKRQNVTIILVDQKKTPVQRWTFREALPVKWTGPQLKADQSASAVQALVLTHRGLLFT